MNVAWEHEDELRAANARGDGDRIEELDGLVGEFAASAVTAAAGCSPSAVSIFLSPLRWASA